MINIILDIILHNTVVMNVVSKRGSSRSWDVFVSVSSGSDVVDWLFHHVEGFSDRREARKYASNLLKAGYIRHTVNKITFSEQCYYIFGDLCGSKWTPSYSVVRHRRNLTIHTL